MVSALNLSTTFLIVCVLGNSFATPLSRFARAASAAPHSKPHHVDESWKNFAQTSEWIFHSLQQIVRGALEKGFENMATWALDMALRMELFVMADGSHFMFPLSPKTELEEEYKTTAIAVSKLMLNLTTMQRADALITQVMRKWIEENNNKAEDFKSPEKLLRTTLYEYVQAVDHVFTEDAELGVEYKKQFVDATGVVKQNSKMHEAFFKVWVKKVQEFSYDELMSFLQDKMTLRQIMASKSFLKQSVKHLSMIFSQTEHKRFLVAKAILEEAMSAEYGARVNEIYHQALVEAAKIPLKKCPDATRAMADELFAAMQKRLESEPKLQQQIRALEKQIETKTVYDTDMLHFDFSIV